MRFVTPGSAPRRAMRKPAMLLVFVAQLVLMLTPVLEGVGGPDARGHVEEAGIRIHHVHDEAYCSACTVRHLLASSTVVPPVEIATVHDGQASAAERTEIHHAVATATTRSRAPPAQL
jgi:hypothetical protein